MIKYKITTISEPDKILVVDSMYKMHDFIRIMQASGGLTIGGVFYTVYNIAKIELYKNEVEILCE